MQIINVDITQLKKAEYNPRQMTKQQHDHLRESIERFGLVDPVIVNENEHRKDIIVGGHMRYEIAKELGMKLIPCVYVNLDEQQEKELNIRLNKNTGEWDFDLLASTFDPDLLVDIGFTDNELGLNIDKIEVDENIEPQQEEKKEKKEVRCPQCDTTFEL